MTGAATRFSDGVLERDGGNSPAALWRRFRTSPTSRKRFPLREQDQQVVADPPSDPDRFS
ncbi:hypothetical protein [Actinomadura vinacea]|uniref:hypothetical protein n=1 Tax=Actinomadura vinacea TaxID=115336 RepID=UPI0031D1ACA5